MTAPSEPRDVSGLRLPPTVDYCPAWCYPEEPFTSGGQHPLDDHRGLKGAVRRSSDPRSGAPRWVHVILHRDNRHGLPAEGLAPAKVALDIGGVELRLTPPEARSVARLLTLAADDLEVHPSRSKVEGLS